MTTSTTAEDTSFSPVYLLKQNAIPTGLFVFALVVFFYRRRQSSKKHEKEKFEMPSEQEIAKLIASWNPEPLATPADASHYALNSHVVQGKMGHYVQINDRKLLNLATMNFLGLVGNERIENVAKQTILKYGVGSCGPRGFYGTVDVHLDLEKQIADFMHCEESALYSYGFATITSAIPAYAKRGDVIFADKAVNFAIQKGIFSSRAKVYYFEHNDVDDLKRVLAEQEKWDKKNPSKANTVRRFLIVEGIYINTGGICPLPEYIALKLKHKFRIFVDESVSFGVLGKTGRGIIEHFGCEVEDVDMVMATMEMAVASTGGFCVGRSFVIEHHRLSGLGYCFSASLPPLLATAAGEALNIINEEPARVLRLQSNAADFRLRLSKTLEGTDFYLDSHSFEASPILHLKHRSHDEKKLDELVDKAFKDDILLQRARYLSEWEHHQVEPSIRIAVNSELTFDEIERVVKSIGDYVR